jgi:hypothetical protein
VPILRSHKRQSVLRFFETPRKAEIAAERLRERNGGEDVMKVLVIASEPVSADRLRAALSGETDNAEIMVIARYGESIDADALHNGLACPSSKPNENP